MEKIFYLIILLILVFASCTQTANEKIRAGIMEKVWKQIQEDEKKNSKEAISLYTKAIENSPNDSIAYLSRGKARSHQEDYSGAISDFTKFIQITHNNADVYSERGFAKYQLQDYKEAIADYTKALEMNPGAGHVRGDSDINNLKNNTDSASSNSKYLLININNYNAYVWRGLAKLGVKDTLGAIADYSKAIEINPKDDIAYTLRGGLKVDLNDMEGAAADFDKTKQYNEN